MSAPLLLVWECRESPAFPTSAGDRQWILIVMWARPCQIGGVLMADSIDAASRVRLLNDEMRQRGPRSTARERWLVTQGVLALGSDRMAEVMRLVQTFVGFEEADDPYGEHDFGSITLGDQQVFWKIDYYDQTLSEGSPDPSDETVTCRVLTIMLSSEY